MHLHRPIPVEVGLEVCARIRDAVPGTAFGVESLHGIALESGFRERYPMPPGTRRGLLADVYDAPAVKILARHEELEPQEFWDRGAAAVGDLATVTWSSATSLLEISAAGVTKATTLALLCERRGIGAEEVVAFGDMPNDLAMLKWAGTSYAMANAHPSVLDVADHVAPANDADGVAVVIEQLLAERVSQLG